MTILTIEIDVPNYTPGVVPAGIDAAEVRAWAKMNGWWGLGKRGRLPACVTEDYIAAKLEAALIDTIGSG